MATGETEHDDPAERLRRADRRVREVEGRIDAAGEADVERVAEAYRTATDLLNRYEGRATGTGGEEFKAFVRFQQELESFVEDLDDDLPHRGAFEAMEDRLDKRRVSEDDFERARAALADPEEKADLLDERATARRRYREARKAVRLAVDDLGSEIGDLERLLELGEADIDAPVERIREPVEAYDDAVREAFDEFKRDRPAREVLGFVADTADYPLVAFRQPPERLREYVAGNEAGAEPIPTLLEYSDYSRSKLAHYVDDAGALKRNVATEETYLRRLDGEPLTVGWPPPTAEELWFRVEELIAVCSRFAPEPVVERARTVRNLPRRVDYARLREAAVARDRLGPDERRRLAEGDVASELSALRDRRGELSELLEELPER
jgi:hypothetical protein